jgi:hypothetical protein
MFFSTPFNPQQLLNLTSAGVSDWFFEFDYWVSQTNETCAPIALNFYEPNNSSRASHPVSQADLLENFTRMNDQYDFTDLVYNLEQSFKHYSTSAVTDFLQTLQTTSELAFAVLTVDFTGNENQTAYLDNFRLTPARPYHTPQSSDNGYRLELDGALLENNYFGPLENAKVVQYPFIYLEDVLSLDPSYVTGKDYEFVVRLFDPTNDYSIFLHYFWSDDSEIYSEGYTDRQLVVDGNQLDFYLRRSEQLNGSFHLLQLDLLNSLNLLVQESGIPIDREHTIHTLDFSVAVANASTHLQIGSLAVEGVAPWRLVDSQYLSHTYPDEFLGEITGKSEITVLANTYLWSEVEQSVKLQAWSVTEDIAGGKLVVSLNGQHVLHIDPSVPGEGGYSTPKTEEVVLQPGVNKLLVNVQNSKEGAPFKVRFLTLDDEVLSNVHLLDHHYEPACYPVVSGNIGNGLVTFMGFDYESLETPLADDEPLLNYFKNILLYELEHRNLEYKTVLQSLMSVVEYSLQHKHQDISSDWENQDDPFPDYGGDDDVFAIFDEIAAIKREVTKYFGQIFAAARAPIGIVLTSDEQAYLSILLSKLFHAARMNGWNTAEDYPPYGESYWYPYVNDPIIRTDDDLTPEYLIDRDYCVSIAERELLGGYAHFFFYIKGLPWAASDGGAYVKLQKVYNTYNPPQVDEDFIGFTHGEFRVLSDTTTWVDTTIKSENEAHVGPNYYLSASNTTSYSLLEVLNATFQAIENTVPFKQHMNQEATMSNFLDLIPNSHLQTPISDIGLGRNINSYVDSIQMDLFQEAFTQASDYFFNLLFSSENNSTALKAETSLLSSLPVILASQNSEEGDISDENTDSKELSKNNKPTEKNSDHFSKIQLKHQQELLNYGDIGWDLDSKAHAMFHNKAGGDYKIGTSYGYSHYYDAPYQLLQLLGDHGDFTTTKRGVTGVEPTLFTRHLIQLIATIKSLDRINPLPENAHLSTTFLATQTNLVLTKAFRDQSEKAELRWLRPGDEGTVSEAQSLLNFGINKNIAYTLDYSKATGSQLILQEELQIDRNRFENAILEIMGDEESPFYYGTDNCPLKLEIVTKNIENGEFVEYFRIKQAFGEYDTGLDILLRRKADTSSTAPYPEHKYIYEIYTIDENQQAVFFTNTIDNKARVLAVSAIDIETELAPDEITDINQLFVNPSPQLTNYLNYIKTHPYYQKMEQEGDNPLTFKLLPGKTENGKYVYKVNLKNQKTILAFKGASCILSDGDAIRGVDENPAENGLKTTAFDIDTGEISVTSSAHQKNNYLVTTHTMTGNSLSYNFWTSFSQRALYTQGGIGTHPDDILFPLLVFPKVVDKFLEMNGGNYDDEVITDLNLQEDCFKISEMFDDAAKELITKVFGTAYIPNSDDETESLTITLVRDKLFDNDFKPNKELFSHIKDLMLFDHTPSESKHTMLRTSQISHSLRTLEQQKTMEFLEQRPETEQTLRLNSIEFQQISRANNMITSEGVDYIQLQSPEPWLNRGGNTHMFRPSQGRSDRVKGESYDYNGDSDSYSPIPLCSKLFQYMLGYNGLLPRDIRIRGNPIYDENGDPCYYEQKGNTYYMTLFEDGGEYERGKGFVTAPQWLALRWMIIGLADVIASTSLVDSEKNKPLNDFIEAINLREIAAALANPDQFMKLYGFQKGSHPNINPEEMESLTNKIVERTLFNTQHSFVSIAELKRGIKHANLKSFIKSYTRSLVQTFGSVPIFSSTTIDDKTGELQFTGNSAVTILDLLLAGSIKVETKVNPDKTIERTFYKEYAYYNTENGELDTVRKKLGPGDFQEITEDFSEQKTFQNFYCAPNKEEAKNLPMGKVWVIKLGTNSYLPLVNFYTSIIRPIETGMKKGEETTTEHYLAQYRATAEDLQALTDTVSGLEQFVDNPEKFLCPTFIQEQVKDLRQEINTEIGKELIENGNELPGEIKVETFGRFRETTLDALTCATGGTRNIDAERIYEQFSHLNKRQMDAILEVYNLWTLCKQRQKEKGEELQFSLLNDILNQNDFHQFYDLIRTKQGINLLNDFFLTDTEVRKVSIRKLKDLFLGASLVGGSFVLQQSVSLLSNIKTQLWQSKLIEFFTHAAQQDTIINNILTMQDLNGNHNYTDDGDSRGRYIERYAFTNPLGNTTSYMEGMVMGVLTWITDYIEVGPMDMFEYINGILAGSQMAKVQFGLQPIVLDVPETIAHGLLGIAQHFTGFDAPEWLKNSTQALSHPAFKAFWHAYLFSCGSMISVITELIKQATWATAIGGLVSTVISLAASAIVNQIWSSINTLSAIYLLQTNNPYHWSIYTEGDRNMGFKIISYKIASYLYTFSSPFHVPHWFAEIFYLSTYFPDIGFWAGPFDSLLPFLVLDIVGLWLLLGGCLEWSSGFLLGLSASAAVTVGVVLLTVLALFIVTFIILAILKSMGLFKIRNPSSEGDRH